MAWVGLWRRAICFPDMIAASRAAVEIGPHARQIVRCPDTFARPARMP
jgi:hypothetical protein